MKTVIVLSLLSLFACNDHKKEPVDTTRTTSAIVVPPTMHDGHAAEPNNTEQNYEPNERQDQNMDMDLDKDVDEAEMSGVSRDGG